MSYSDVPIWEKHMPAIEEAAEYSRIGEKKLRKLVEESSDANWLIMSGNRAQIKRRQFEKVVDSLGVIQSQICIEPEIRYTIFESYQGSFQSWKGVLPMAEK